MQLNFILYNINIFNSYNQVQKSLFLNCYSRSLIHRFSDHSYSKKKIFDHIQSSFYSILNSPKPTGSFYSKDYP